MSDTRFIMYGRHAHIDDWIDPSEIFTSPDPDGTGAVYLLVWSSQAVCEAYIGNVGASGSAVARPVRVSSIQSLSAQSGMRLALDPDERGATRVDSSHSATAVPLDEGVEPPPPLPSGWGATHVMAYVLLMGAAIEGPISASSRLVTGEQLVLGGLGPEFANPLIDEVANYMERCLQIGGIPTAFALLGGFVPMLSRHFETDGLQYVLRSLIAVITVTGTATGRQKAYLDSLAESWGLVR